MFRRSQKYYFRDEEDSRKKNFHGPRQMFLSGRRGGRRQKMGAQQHHRRGRRGRKHKKGKPSAERAAEVAHTNERTSAARQALSLFNKLPDKRGSLSKISQVKQEVYLKGERVKRNFGTTSCMIGEGKFSETNSHFQETDSRLDGFMRNGLRLQTISSGENQFSQKTEKNAQRSSLR